jgi:methylthioribose-1-phosphate isomerase
MKIETLRWSGDCLETIDQRVLSTKFEYLRFSDDRSVADGIRTIAVRDAPAIGVAAAYGVALKEMLCQIYQKVILKRPVNWD